MYANSPGFSPEALWDNRLRALIVSIIFDSGRLPGSPGPKQVLLNVCYALRISDFGNYLWVSGISCFFVYLSLVVYRLLGTLKSQICCACHAFFMFFMFRKIIILDDFWPLKIIPKPQFFMFFGMSFLHVFCMFLCCICMKTSIFACIRSVWWGSRFFMFSVLSCFVVFFQALVFLGVQTSLFSV